MTRDISFSIVFLCGGIGSRANLPIPKQFHKIAGKELFQYSLETLFKLPFKEFCVVCDQAYKELFIKKAPGCLFAAPGARRQDSTENGLKALKASVDYVLVHDSARPFVTQQALNHLLAHLGKEEGVTLGYLATSTMRIATSDMYGQSTLPRELTWEIQTPQLIKTNILEKGLNIAKERNLTLTDDVACLELLGGSPKLVQGERSNIKITTPEDLQYAEFFLNKNK